MNNWFHGRRGQLLLAAFTLLFLAIFCGNATAQLCVDTPALLDFIDDWAQGDMTMPQLFTQIATWKAETICIQGECGVQGTTFTDPLDNMDCISNSQDVIFSSGLASPSGATSGELEADPSMEALLHFDNTHKWEDDERNTYDFAYQRHPAIWDSVGLWPTSGKFGQAYFMAQNGSRNTPYINSTGINSDNVTVSMWVQSTGGLDMRLMWTVFDGGITYYLRLQGSNIRFYPTYETRRYIDSGAIDWQLGDWHHVAAVYQSGNHQLWVDGTLAGTLADTGPMVVGNSFGIGRDWSPVSGEDLAIDEFAVWNRVLNPDEIQALASGQRIRTGSFESDWINMGGSYNSIKAELQGQSTETTMISISCDGSNWAEVENGKWSDYTLNRQLPCSSFKYRVRFSGGAPGVNLDRVQFDWGNVIDDPNQFTFVVYGDDRGDPGGGSSGLYRLRIIEFIKEINPPIVLHTGDMANRGRPSTFFWDWIEFGRSIEPLVERAPAPGLDTAFYATIGNHESNPPYYGYFDVLDYQPHYGTVPADPDGVGSCSDNRCPIEDPDNPGYDVNMYYTFKYRNACFICLYNYDYDTRSIRGTNIDGTSELGTTQYTEQPINVDDLTWASVQYKWLYGVLQDCENDPDIKWKFVLEHTPPFSSGSHGTSTEPRYNLGQRKHLSALLDRFNVDMIFAGHDHDYERTHPIKVVFNPGAPTLQVFDGEVDPDGVVYIVSGAAGRLNEGHVPPDPLPDWSVRYDAIRHFMKLTVSDTAINGQAIDIDGTVFDTFSLIR